MKRGNVNSVIRIPAPMGLQFFRMWLLFLAPFHNMAGKEMDVASAFLKRRYDLSLVISDTILLEETVLNRENKRRVREYFNLSSAHFQIIMRKLKEKNFIVNDRINPKFIPKNIKKGDPSFQLLLYFDLT